MKLEQFEAFVRENWRAKSDDDGGLRDLFVMTTGLAGETGEAVDVIKKSVRDGTLDRDKLVLELGDVLHYWIKICQRFNIEPDEVMTANVAKLAARRAAKERVAQAAAKLVDDDELDIPVFLRRQT